ncbi:30S ribosomal protein S18 [Candidatus Microgenomates bacterium]|nr:30S ribosomal protein S18 [Candidatus Microgenomates bacterium]
MIRGRRSRRIKVVKQNCPFCKQKTEPSFREIEVLRRYVTERGKIIGHARSGICAKHQRKVTAAIKQARILALLPFIVKPSA